MSILCQIVYIAHFSAMSKVGPTSWLSWVSRFPLHFSDFKFLAVPKVRFQQVVSYLVSLPNSPWVWQFKHKGLGRWIDHPISKCTRALIFLSNRDHRGSQFWSRNSSFSFVHRTMKLAGASDTGQHLFIKQKTNPRIEPTGFPAWTAKQSVSSSVRLQKSLQKSCPKLCLRAN